MDSERRPKLGDTVIFWTNGVNPEDPCVPNVGLVCNVANEGNFLNRPNLVLNVALAPDYRFKVRAGVQCVIDDGGQLHMAGKYSMPGDYTNDGTN